MGQLQLDQLRILANKVGPTKMIVKVLGKQMLGQPN